MPSDPILLLSFVNTKLRDYYQDIESLCFDYDVSVEEVSDKLEAIGYRYDRGLNSYIAEMEEKQV